MRRSCSICLIAMAAVLGAGSAWAVDTTGDTTAAPVYGWKNEAVGGINVTQASFDNWAAGGENTIAWQLNLIGKAVRLAPSSEWTNSGKIAYGQAKIGDDDAKKSVDEIRLEAVMIFKAGLYVDPYVAAAAWTQFFKGYQYPDSGKMQVSAFLDPGYFTQSAGIGRSFGDILRTRLGAAIKETVTDKFASLYADDLETHGELEKTRVEFGAESVTDLSLKLSENLLFTSKVELFSNLEAFDEIDINWDNLLTAKVAKYVDVTLNVRTVYDSNVSTKRQIKQALALGLTYSFL